ncbi:MAG: Nif3-like dinuclear metal center hexameric protein [Candidatus Schekmanbacteria bacterium]|nr:Nif3-like dinuclear metal center hexameric protein [Candidatus Schekmanbacteria bacterium]
MSASRDDIVRHLADTLQPESIADACPQGLQVEGRDSVDAVAFAVSVCEEVIRAAAAFGAGMLVVHHGMFWDRDPRVLRGAAKGRVKALLGHDISLLCYHLCLDCHETLGNNARFADLLDLQDRVPFGSYHGRYIGVLGRLADSCAPQTFAANVDALLEVPGPSALFLGGTRPVSRVAIVTGSAAGLLEQAAEAGADLYLTGEPGEGTFSLARELGLHMLAAGHYRTERLGPLALKERIEQRFAVRTTFIDIPNTV